MMETLLTKMVAILNVVSKLAGVVLLEASPQPAHALKSAETELFMIRVTENEMMEIQ